MKVFKKWKKNFQKLLRFLNSGSLKVKNNLLVYEMLLRIILVSLSFGFLGPLFAKEISYIEHIRPIFKDHCLNCHNPDKSKAGLDLSTMAGVLEGGSGGEIVKAGVPDSSSLYLSVIHHDSVEPMPPKKPKLPKAKLDLIRNWIQGGLIENAGGKSKLRKISFDVSAGNTGRPENPAMPEKLEKLDLLQNNPITSMAVSPWAPLAAVARNGGVEFFNLKDNKKMGALPFEHDIFDMKFSRNGEILLIAGGRGAHTGLVTLFDVKTGKKVATLGDETDVVLAADISFDHRFVVIGTPTKMVKIFEVKSGKLLHSIKRHTDWVTAVSFAPADDRVATGDRNGNIFVWEAARGAILFTLSDHKQRVSQMAWRSDGKMLASGGDGGKLILWDMKDGWPAKVVDAHKSRSNQDRYTRNTGVLSLDWARDGTLVTTGRDHKVRLWKADGNRLKDFQNLSFLPTAVRIIPEKKNLLVATFDGKLYTAADYKAKTLESFDGGKQ